MSDTATALNASDAAVALAAEHDLDLADVTGSGAGGKVTQPDVQKHLASLGVTDDDAAGDTAEPKKGKAAKEYYCPGCGQRSATPGECTGPAGGIGGHAPIAYVDAGELAGDEHTPAPNTE